MYHQILADPGADRYNQTPQQFRAELERLAREGYVPVTAADLVARRIDIPAGKHPVVLTFDDSTTSQLALGPDGEPKPDTAVGILLDVARANPGFTPVATMYVNAAPFADRDGKATLGWLHAHGFEVGDHTESHANLKKLDAAGVQRELAGDLARIRAAVPGIEVTTMALPFGVFPSDRALAARGSANGVSYDFGGVMLVGSNPAPSPYAAAWKPLAVPRIRSYSLPGADAPYESAHWLDVLAGPDGGRYTSDGDPTTISFPAAERDRLDPRYAGQANPY